MCPPATATPRWRHACHFGGLLLLAGAALGLALPVRPPLSLSGLLQVLYALAVALNVWQLALSTWSSVLGAAVACRDRAARHLGRRPALADAPILRPPTGRARTAVLLPVHEEDATRVFALAAVTADALAARQKAGERVGQRLGVVDIFVLSDTRSIAGAAQEERVARRLAAIGAADGRPPVFYRRRIENTGRKAGNIAEFCARWGASYDFLVVLDADSLMSGEAIARLIGAMEANPGAGLIQAMCYPLGRSTLFARLQQFGARLHGPAFQRGVAFWQGPRGNYWGHNAILRAGAFAGACGLPVLPGPPPFGGEIMSHDTVEAALMLRAGYDAWMLPDSPGRCHDGNGHGSWEETPTNLVDNLGRDRRWCQGNLQHMQVLRASGLRLASYYHLTRGLLHYLYTVPFLAWLILYATVDRHPAPGCDRALLILVGSLLLARRLIGLAEALLTDASGFGGAAGLTTSAALDALVDALCYPVLVTFHALFLAAALAGRAVRWDAQGRGDRDLDWRQAWRVMGPPLAGALAAVALIAPAAPLPAVLLAPGLILGVPFAVWSSRRDLGLWARRHGLFQIPDETRPPSAWTALQRAEAALAATTAEAEPAPLPPARGPPLIVPQLRRPGLPSVVRAT